MMYTGLRNYYKFSKNTQLTTGVEWVDNMMYTAEHLAEGFAATLAEKQFHVSRNSSLSLYNSKQERLKFQGFAATLAEKQFHVSRNSSLSLYNSKQELVGDDDDDGAGDRREKAVS
ncbi:hypothetical protein QE152_g20 [Popillia japonica]|uniref:Uncharacterized protein n=1 Tax=Popillia japonica TaxID=7064 RepID=A0AAW1NKZ7_POPJA